MTGQADAEVLDAMNCAVDDPVEGALVLPELAARLCSGAVAISASTAAWLLLVAEFDRREGWAVPGVASCAHWLSWQCGIAPGTAREHVRLARALPGLPRLTDELAPDPHWPPYWPANGARMDLRHVVSTVLQNRTALRRRQVAEQAAA